MKNGGRVMTYRRQVMPARSGSLCHPGDEGKSDKNNHTDYRLRLQAAPLTRRAKWLYRERAIGYANPCGCPRMEFSILCVVTIAAALSVAVYN